MLNKGSMKLFQGDIPEPTTLKRSVIISDAMKKWSFSTPMKRIQFIKILKLKLKFK
jgi:hypothetical protein